MKPAALRFGVATLTLLLGVRVTLAQNATPPPAAPARAAPAAGALKLTPDLPTDLPIPATLAQADAFGWQLFSALSWPVAPGKRGVPDTNRKLGDPGATVWLSFKNADEVFLANGADPGPWNSAPAAPVLRLRQTAKAAAQVQRLSAINQAVGGPLTDQQGRLVYYQKAANEISYEFIRRNKLYDAAVQKTFTGAVNFPNGAIEVKTAWRVLTSLDPATRYYTSPAVIPGPDGKDLAVTVGLVGLHLTMKTPHAPQWIWATFEQVDNVPPVVGGVRSSFHNPASTQPANKETPPGTPTQVTRTLAQLPPDVRALNANWQAALAGTPWQYYQLIGVQYPSEPLTPGTFDGVPRPLILANTVLETYVQDQSSCISCHSTARAQNGRPSDFSFFLLNAQSSAAK